MTKFTPLSPKGHERRFDPPAAPVFGEAATEKLRGFVQNWLDESPAKGLRFTYPDAEALAEALKA
jgi:hypothetical protein